MKKSFVTEGCSPRKFASSSNDTCEDNMISSTLCTMTHHTVRVCVFGKSDLLFFQQQIYLLLKKSRIRFEFCSCNDSHSMSISKTIGISIVARRVQKTTTTTTTNRSFSILFTGQRICRLFTSGNIITDGDLFFFFFFLGGAIIIPLLQIC